MPPYLTTEQLTRDLALRDLTDPAAGPHAIQSLVGLAAEALVASWACPTRPSPGPRIVPIADNYDNLGFTAGAASRDAHYTRLRRRRTDVAQPLQRDGASGSARPRRRCSRRRPAGLPRHRVPPGRHRPAAHWDPAPARPVARLASAAHQRRHGRDDRPARRRADPRAALAGRTTDPPLHRRRPSGRRPGRPRHGWRSGSVASPIPTS